MEKETTVRLSFSRVCAIIVENTATEQPIYGETKTRIKGKPDSTENATTSERRSIGNLIVGRKRKEKNMTWHFF